ncbi:MAG: hypothetical protein ACM3ZB_08295 [bacterium]|jgi:hypothetical protein
MRARNLFAGLAIVVALPLALAAQDALPQIKSCAPATVKAGDIVTVAGENLGQASIDKVFLTDGSKDIALEVQAQSATEMKLRVPSDIGLGRFAFLILTRGDDPKLIEQPVKLTVSDKTEPEPAPAPAEEQPPTQQ